MKKVIPIVLVAIVIAVVSGVVVSRLGATQASDKKPSTVTQNSPTLTANSQPNKPEDVQILKGSARTDEDSKTKPFIGIRMGNLPDSEADALGIDGGVVVKAVGDGSPAAGKLMVDDIITSIARDGDEIPITSAEGVFEVVMDSEPGDTLAFEVLRDGDTVLVEVEVGEHEVRAIVRHKGVVSPLGIGNLMRYLRGNFVSDPGPAFFWAMRATDSGVFLQRVTACSGGQADVRERLQRIVPRIRERLKEHDFDLEQFLDESEIEELLEGVSSF